MWSYLQHVLFFKEGSSSQYFESLVLSVSLVSNYTPHRYVKPIEPPKSLLSLPPEIQLYILSFLSPLDIATSISRINHHFQKLSFHPRLWQHLTLGDRTRPGVRLINGMRIDGEENFEKAVSILSKYFYLVETLLIFDICSFPFSKIQTLSSLVTVQMDTYDFIRLESNELACLVNIKELFLFGKFIAHHEARKVFKKISKFSQLKTFKTNNFLEPHIDLRTEELNLIFKKLKNIEIFGILFDNETEGESFWENLEKLNLIHIFGAGISDVSSGSVESLLNWIPSTCQDLFIQFADYSNRLVPIENYFQILKNRNSPLKLYIDFCGITKFPEKVVEKICSFNPEYVQVFYSPFDDMSEKRFFKNQIFQ